MILGFVGLCFDVRVKVFNVKFIGLWLKFFVFHEKKGCFDCFNHVVKIDVRVVPLELHFSYEEWQHHNV